MLKRLFDITVGTALLLASIPVIVGLALALVVELRTVPFFVQWRIGKDGRLFRFLKLRTLPPDTDRYALKHELDGASLSRFRAFLRRTHLDELPQLLQVATGQLSLVGPRPRMPDEPEPLDPDFASSRVTVPQGCTGLWQVGAHAHLLISDHPEYDRIYVEHATLGLDLWILWRTVVQMIGVGAPVELGHVPRFLLRGAPTPSLTTSATASTSPVAGSAEAVRDPLEIVIDLTADPADAEDGGSPGKIGAARTVAS